MKRDIAAIQRDLEKKNNNDIIWRKNQIRQIFLSDPDLLEVLGEKEPRPLNSYADKDHPTEDELAERQSIEEYNEKITHEQIVDYIKLNGIQTEVLNFVMFDIDDEDVSYTNNAIKTQYLYIVCLVHENDMQTEYGIVRTDLLDYIIRDLLCWSNCLGSRLKLINDYHDIFDRHYYGRTMKFEMETVNAVGAGVSNAYDKFRKI